MIQIYLLIALFVLLIVMVLVSAYSYFKNLLKTSKFQLFCIFINGLNVSIVAFLCILSGGNIFYLTGLILAFIAEIIFIAYYLL